MKNKIILTLFCFVMTGLTFANPVLPSFEIKNMTNHSVDFKIVNLLAQNQILHQYATQLFGSGQFKKLSFTPDETITLPPGGSEIFQNNMNDIVKWFKNIGASGQNAQIFYAFAAQNGIVEIKVHDVALVSVNSDSNSPQAFYNYKTMAPSVIINEQVTNGCDVFNLSNMVGHNLLADQNLTSDVCEFSNPFKLSISSPPVPYGAVGQIVIDYNPLF